MKNSVRNLIFVILIIGILQSASVLGATLTVNDSQRGIVCDQSLTLDEAATFARDGTGMRNLTDGEKAQISGVTWILVPPGVTCSAGVWRAAANGGVGFNFADDIFFTNDVTQINDSIALGRNDDIDGLKPNGTKVILDGSGLGATNGIGFSDPSTMLSGSQIRNLVIRNYQLDGITVSLANGAIFEGLEIHNNGRHGILLTTTPGVLVNNRDVRIGGDQPQHRNLIYGNGGDGISIIAWENNDRFPNMGIVIKNNFIGTSNGTSNNGNGNSGISLLHAFGVTIGDTTGATRNIISGNNNDGITIKGAKAYSNLIVWNFIGVAQNGSSPLGNGASGVALLSGAGDAADFISSTANRIGLPGLGNTIGANNFGVFVADANTSNNWIRGNYIGTNTGTTVDVGNASDGVYFVAGTFDNIVGGTATGEGNVIAFNRNGIRNDGDIRNAFRRNRVFSNDLLGIDLTPNVGVTPNDTGDGDTGANNLQNFPFITYVNAQNGSTNIQGNFNSAANQTYTLEFFGNTGIDTTGFGEGRNFLGEATVTTNASGNATFNQTFPVNLSSVGTWITATATDANGNTSEFSQARNICADLTITPPGIVSFSNGGAGNFTVTNSAGCSYTATSNSPWITLGSTSMGTVNYTIAPNPGVQRSGSITVQYNNGSFITGVNFNVTQQNGCTYSLNPTNRNISGAGANSSFNVVASDSSCPWTATSNAAWITNVTSSGTGSSAVNFTVAANSGAARSGTITAGGQTFTVNQDAACSYSLSQTSVNIPANGANGSFQVICGSGCTWTAVSNNAWITGNTNGNGTGFVFYNVAANTGAARTGTFTAGGLTFTVNQAAATARRAPFDYDGDNKTDISIFRPAQGEWWLNRSSNGSTFVTQFGTSSDKIVPADYTGDGKTDIAYWKPSTGQWFILRSENLTFFAFPFGQNGDIPVPADYDGDDKDDAAVFRPSSQTWFINKSTGGTEIIGFGAANDKPVVADYDGDGKADIAIYRINAGFAEWWIRRSSNGTVFSTQFGLSTDKAVPGDYTGDGKTDIAFWRPSNGNWFILRSEDLSFFSFPFGANGDVPVSGDYDGDGIFDVGIFRPSSSNWFVQRSTAGTLIQQFGANGDLPTPNAFVP